MRASTSDKLICIVARYFWFTQAASKGVNTDASFFSGGVNQLYSYLLNRMRKISQKHFQRISAEYLLYVFKHTVRSQNETFFRETFS